MHVAFDTNELSPKDIQMLTVLVGEGDWPATPVAKPAPAKAEEPVKDTAEEDAAKAAAQEAAKKAALAKKAEAEAKAKAEAAAAAPEPEEDLVGGESEPEPEGPTMADAVAAATKLVSGGNAAKVKEALAAVGAKRVSEVAEGDIAAFLDALK